VQFQLSDPDPNTRSDALDSIAQDPQAQQLAALRASIATEQDATLKARKMRLERLVTLRFDEDVNARVAAIKSFAGDTHVDVRAALNPILATTTKVAASLPETENVARKLTPGPDSNLSIDAAYAMLVAANLAPPSINDAERDATLVANLKDGKVGGFAREALDTPQARDEAYDALVKAGITTPFVRATARAQAVSKFVYYDAYNEPSPAITVAALSTVDAIDTTVKVDQIIELILDAISLASIYFLAAIGLAITFGVMRVINMAHGEFIMIGAYTGYVVQQYVANATASIIIALPVAFVITFAAGIALERLVIRKLIRRPLETLLATFGVSIALQQIAKNIFGTQARPLTSPDWLGGALHFNDNISISYIRIAIFVLAIIFFTLLLLLLNKTRLGLEVRAVTQNRRMAASMGINPDRINMLTFGLGSGIAGIAGVAIGLYAQVTSEIGSNYIVMSFMAVVVGGVGNIWGTLAGAGLTGVMQKFIEWFNPSNTLAAQTFMVIFIIVFIQFRPRGIVALKGRAAGD
ncbi:MAG: urea ABC transporter permease subunit UrtB, partial [Aestuariivirga sp.]